MQNHAFASVTSVICCKKQREKSGGLFIQSAKTGLWDKDMSRLFFPKNQLDKLCLYHTPAPRFCKERTRTSFVEEAFFHRAPFRLTERRRGLYKTQSGGAYYARNHSGAERLRRRIREE